MIEENVPESRPRREIFFRYAEWHIPSLPANQNKRVILNAVFGGTDHYSFRLAARYCIAQCSRLKSRRTDLQICNARDLIATAQVEVKFLSGTDLVSRWRCGHRHWRCGHWHRRRCVSGSGSRMHVIDAAATALSRHCGHRVQRTIVQIERAARWTNFFDILDKPAELPLQCSK
jgi:hypothetical protein